MANKRKLKKAINYICSDLFSECIANNLYNGEKKKDDINAMLASILIVHSNYIRRVSHPEPGMTCKAYYADLKEKFSLQVGELADNIASV